MAEYDLTSQIGGYLDRHLVFPMLEFLSEKRVYDEADMLRARIELLSKTNMVDYAIDVYKQLHSDEEDPPEPQEMTDRRREVVEKLHEFEQTIDPIVQLFEDPEVQEYVENRKEDQSLFEYLAQNHDLKPEMVDLVYSCAKFKYECGNYSDASEYLYFYRVLAPSDHKNVMSAMWGKLSCSILMQDWETALEDLNRLRRDIDEALNTSHLMRLQQRTWLIHWSLFVFFNHPKGQDDIIQLFLYQQDYLNAIQTCCPHILRYVTAAVITNKRRQSLLKDLIRVIRQASSSAHQDPIKEFVECLYVNYDFDLAQQKLLECEKVLDHDFFLVACRAEFIENARLSIFETFCRVHQCISISMLATKLNLSADDAERWIVNLIRNAKLDAKIDAKEGHVVMNTQPPSIYQRVIDKTKALAFQSQFIAQNIDKRLSTHTAAMAAAPIPAPVIQGDERCAKALIAFGANINAMNDFDMTPLDMAIQNRQEALVPLLVSVGCERGELIKELVGYSSSPRSIECSDCSECSELEFSAPAPEDSHFKEEKRKLFGHTKSEKSALRIKRELENHMQRRFEGSSIVPDEAFAMAVQQQEISRFQSASPEGASQLDFDMEGGSRILTLDGGGIRGLVQIEILSEIERLTGKKITELFDWIIGTSTGGILALGLVYCGKSLTQLRELYFRLKEQIFARSRMGYAYNSKALEELLKEELGTELNMCDVEYPKVLITAVEKKTTQPKLHFFNNCFGDELSTQPIWKVARYTSAAPMYFTECDNYVDGGVLANNPSESALAAIQKFYRERDSRLPIACVVSVGSGKDPAENLGSVDAHEILHFGLMKVRDMFRRVHNLVELLTSALVESEAVADRCRCSCVEQGIHFYRFSPQLDKKVEPGETDNNTLLDMMITAKTYINGDACAQMDSLIPTLIACLSEADRSFTINT